MRWIGSFLLGIIIWYILLFILGVIVGKLGFAEMFINNSTLIYVLAFPISMYLTFKITKTKMF